MAFVAETAVPSVEEGVDIIVQVFQPDNPEQVQGRKVYVADARLPVLVLVHPFGIMGGCGQMMWGLAATLAKAGYSVVVVNLRGAWCAEAAALLCHPHASPAHSLRRRGWLQRCLLADVRGGGGGCAGSVQVGAQGRGWHVQWRRGWRSTAPSGGRPVPGVGGGLGWRASGWVSAG